MSHGGLPSVRLQPVPIVTGEIGQQGQRAVFLDGVEMAGAIALVQKAWFGSVDVAKFREIG